MPREMQMDMTAKQQAVISQVFDDFREGRAIPKLAVACFSNPKIPAHKWTLRNQMLAYLTTGSLDARGYKQWKRVGRTVKRGTRAGFIWQPLKRYFKTEEKDPKTGQVKVVTRSYVYGYRALAKFGKPDTDGKPLDYEKEICLPEKLPLREVAEEWGIKVNAEWMLGAHGSFAIDGSAITIGVKAEYAPKVFFHELAHAAHGKVLEKWGKKLQGGQQVQQEIVAEMSAEILRRMLDPNGEIYPDTSGNSLDYIKHYAEAGGMDLPEALLKVLGEVGQVITLILEVAGLREPVEYGSKSEPRSAPCSKGEINAKEMEEINSRYS